KAHTMIARRSLPIQAWPVLDQIAWEAALATGDLLERDGPAAHWSPATQRTTAKSYGHWIAWLTQTRQLDAETSPPARATPERIANYVTHLREQNASSTVAARVLQLREALRVMAPGTDLGQLQLVVRGLRAGERPSRVKRSRIRHPRDLFVLGFEIMHRAET